MAGFFNQAPAMNTRTLTTPFPKAEIGPEMKGSDAVVECLIREGVEVVFAYPGGASQELHQSLARTDKIRVILPRHEQGGSFAAEGYARATGKVGVCMATSGPGATNLVSAIADAYMDSIPLVAITGQVMSCLLYTSRALSSPWRTQDRRGNDDGALDRGLSLQP